MPLPTTKIVNKKRPHLPKEPSGFVQTSTTIEDGNDAVAYARIFRGTNTTYAIPADVINANLLFHGNALVQLKGSEFCTGAESQICLLADLTALVGTGPLTNNNTVTFVQETADDETPMWEQLYANLVSASNQYLSVPTATALQVGTGSYSVSVAFQTTTNGTLMIIASYGSHVSAKGYWEFRISAANQLVFEQWDATNTDTLTDPVLSRFQDGRWHIATAVLDRTLNLGYLFCDGILLATATLTATNTLTVAGESFYIGTRKNSSGSNDSYFNGKVGLFKLINNVADYNVPQVWNMGYREAVSSGTFTARAADNNKRLNNKFGTPNTNNAYFYTTVFVEDGEYELQVAYEKGSANGQLDIIIDGATVLLQLDTYNGSTTHNNISKTYGIKMSSGYHTVKIYNDGKNASSSGYAVNIQWINLIKRRGFENVSFGDTRFLLLGDELNERASGSVTLTTDTSAGYNNMINWASPANSLYTEGTVFIKGGFYRIDILYRKNTDAGQVDMFIGKAQVLSQFDLYNGSSSYNNAKTVLMQLPQGRVPVRLAMNGKNGSSSNYQIYIQSIRLVRLCD